jgi:hypothetical protein
MSHVAPPPASTELAIMFSMEIIECAHEIARQVVPALKDTSEMKMEFVWMKGFVSQSNSLIRIFLKYACSNIHTYIYIYINQC